MRRSALFLFVALLVLSAVPRAQNEPFLGVWELNLAKSAITRGGPPLYETVVNVPEAGGFRSMLSVINPSSTSVEIHHYNFDGEFHKTEGGDPRELSFKRLDLRAIDQDTRRGTQITANRKITVSADGNTMTYVAAGTTATGQKYSNDTRVYEKK